MRPSDWQVGVSVQQQMLPRVSVEVGYFRRWLQNFIVTDNLAVVASDFDTFSVTAPSDPRLPGGGGNVVPGLYNVSDAKTGQTNSFTTWARNFGDQTSMYNGVLVNLTARAKNFTVQGGVNTGRNVIDSCALRTQLPETNPTNPYCRDDPGFMTRVTGLAAYTVPKLDVLLERYVPQRPGNAACRQLGRLECGSREVARPSAVGRRAERHGEPDRARHAVERSCQRVRPARRQDSPLRPHALDRRH